MTGAWAARMAACVSFKGNVVRNVAGAASATSNTRDERLQMRFQPAFIVNIDALLAVASRVHQ
jgi:lipocalin